MDVQEAKRQQEKSSEWAEVDPFTLVTAARSTLHSETQRGDEMALKPLEEIITRFEQQTRASLGASVRALTTSGR